MSNLNAKNLAASICPQVASVISIIGSYVVMREVLLDHKEKKGKAIPRILFALYMHCRFGLLVGMDSGNVAFAKGIGLPLVQHR